MLKHRLRTLLIFLAIAVLVMVLVTGYGNWLLVVIGWAGLPVFFGLWFWMLCTSQSNPGMRGKPSFDDPSG